MRTPRRLGRTDLSNVRDPLNPLTVPFLAVMQPGSNSSAAPVNAAIVSLDAKMVGVEILQASGVRSIVLFNNQAGQVPAPVTTTSYNVNTAGPVSHTLLGMVPNANYAAVLSGGVMQVNQIPTGNRTASPAGVLYLPVDVLFANGFQ